MRRVCLGRLSLLLTVKFCFPGRAVLGAPSSRAAHSQAVTGEGQMLWSRKLLETHQAWNSSSFRDFLENKRPAVCELSVVHNELSGLTAGRLFLGSSLSNKFPHYLGCCRA